SGGASGGDIYLAAGGGSSDIRSTVDQDAITAPAGSITLDAGRDIKLGTSGVDHDNDVRASGGITLIAGRDLIVDGFSDLASDDFGKNTGAGVSATVGRDVAITNATGDDASLGA